MRIPRTALLAIALLSISPFSSQASEAKSLDDIDLSFNTNDLMILLRASYAKVLVDGVANQKFRLELVDEKGKAHAAQTFEIGENGAGILTVMAYDDTGLGGAGRNVELSVRWETSVTTFSTRLRFPKFWDMKSGRLSTDAGGATFHDSRQRWKLNEELDVDLCKLTRRPNRQYLTIRDLLNEKTVAMIRLVKTPEPKKREP